MFVFVFLKENISYTWNAYFSETSRVFFIVVTFSDVFILFELFDRKVRAQFLNIYNYPWYFFYS